MNIKNLAKNIVPYPENNLSLLETILEENGIDADASQFYYQKGSVNWESIIRPSQKLNENGKDWKIKLVIGDRGEGKTTSAAYWLHKKSKETSNLNSCFISPNNRVGISEVFLDFDNSLNFCVTGPHLNYENKSRIYLHTPDCSPCALRGHRFSNVVIDIQPKYQKHEKFKILLDHLESILVKNGQMIITTESELDGYLLSLAYRPDCRIQVL